MSTTSHEACVLYLVPSIPIICQGISVRRLHISYLAIFRQIAKNLPLATPCDFCFPECRKAHLNLNPLDQISGSAVLNPLHYTFSSAIILFIMVVITRRTTQSIRVTRASCSLAFRVGRDHGHHPLVPYVRVGRRPEMRGVSRGSTTTVATQEVHVPHRPPIRVTRASSSLAFRVGSDHGHHHVPYVRVGRHPEMREVSRGSTNIAATQEVHVPHRPPIPRVTRVSSSLAFRRVVRLHREMQQLGNTKVPSVVLPPSLKSFEGVDLLAKTNMMGTQDSSIFIAYSDPSTPTDSGRHLNSTPDSEKTLPLPTPMQQSLDRFIFRQPKLCPRRRWDVNSCKWIRPAFTFIDDNYPLNMDIN